VLSEGLLNVIGFDKGLPLLADYTKPGGYLVIHDELKDASGKRKIFEDSGLTLISSFILDENVWWNDYFEPLKKKIESLNRDDLFEDDLKYIRECRTKPSDYRSIYYILQK